MANWSLAKFYNPLSSGSQIHTGQCNMKGRYLHFDRCSFTSVNVALPQLPVTSLKNCISFLYWSYHNIYNILGIHSIILTYSVWVKMAKNMQTISSNIFPLMNCLNFSYNITGVCSSVSNRQSAIIGSDNCLAMNRPQAIIWTNIGLVYWSMYVSLGLNESKAFSQMFCHIKHSCYLSNFSLKY